MRKRKRECQKTGPSQKHAGNPLQFETESLNGPERQGGERNQQVSVVKNKEKTGPRWGDARNFAKILRTEGIAREKRSNQNGVLNIIRRMMGKRKKAPRRKKKGSHPKNNFSNSRVKGRRKREVCTLVC